MSLSLFLRRNDAQLQADAQLVHMIWFRDGFSLSNLGRCSGVTLGLLCHAAQSRLSFGCCSEVASLATVTRDHGEHGGCSCEPRRVCSWLSFCLVGLAAVIMKPCLGVHLGALVEALALCPSRTLEPWSQQTRSRAARVDSGCVAHGGLAHIQSLLCIERALRDIVNQSDTMALQPSTRSKIARISLRRQRDNTCTYRAPASVSGGSIAQMLMYAWHNQVCVSSYKHCDSWHIQVGMRKS